MIRRRGRSSPGRCRDDRGAAASRPDRRTRRRHGTGRDCRARRPRPDRGRHAERLDHLLPPTPRRRRSWRLPARSAWPAARNLLEEFPRRRTPSNRLTGGRRWLARSRPTTRMTRTPSLPRLRPVCPRGFARSCAARAGRCRRRAIPTRFATTGTRRGAGRGPACQGSGGHGDLNRQHGYERHGSRAQYRRRRQPLVHVHQRSGKGSDAPTDPTVRESGRSAGRRCTCACASTSPSSSPARRP